MPSEVQDIRQPAVTPEEAQAELDLLLGSPLFARSEKLQRFLRFICEATLKGEAAQINEYLVGSQVFQRGSDYNPNEDSVVRRQAHTLRQKLQEYYAAEGAGHAVRIELPVGRYVPVFKRVENAEPAAIPQASPARTSRYGYAAGLIAVFALGWIAAKLVAPAPPVAAAAMTPALRELWAAWLQDRAEAVICFSNPLTAVVKHFSGPLPHDSVPRRMAAHPEEDKAFREIFKLPAGGAVYFSPAISQAKMGEAIAATHLAAMFARAGNPVETTQSRFLSWEDIRRQNLVLFGHDEANRWIDPLLEKYPFRLAATSGGQPRRIVNTQPNPGEPSEFRITYSSNGFDAEEEYALISMLPGVDGTRQLLLVSGLNTQATQGATEYLTREQTAGQLLERLRAAAPGHSGPWRFQLVLKTEVRDWVPTRASLVLLRVL